VFGYSLHGVVPGGGFIDCHGDPLFVFVVSLFDACLPYNCACTQFVARVKEPYISDYKIFSYPRDQKQFGRLDSGETETGIL
jgi:hypothetical protein